MTLRQSDSAALSIPITMGLGAVFVVCLGHVEPQRSARCRSGGASLTPHVFALLIGSPIASLQSASRISR